MRIQTSTGTPIMAVNVQSASQTAQSPKLNPEQVSIIPIDINIHLKKRAQRFFFYKLMLGVLIFYIQWFL